MISIASHILLLRFHGILVSERRMGERSATHRFRAASRLMGFAALTHPTSGPRGNDRFSDEAA